jgi:O-antigen/teichoic acid export membrane protein
MQSDNQELAHTYRKFLSLSAFVIFPMMAGLSALAHPFVVIVIGHQWEFCAVLLQILCFSLMWYPIHAINLNLLQVKGRTDLSLRLEVIKKIVGVTILCTFVPFGIVALCYSRILSSILCLIINTYYTGKLINVGFLRQMSDYAPTLLISLMMWGVMMTVNSFTDNLYLQILTGVIIGIVFYSLFSYIFNRELFKTTLSLISK